MAGSILAGLAWSMPVLIACRLIQDLGAGAIQPTTATIAGQIYTVEKRARVQGHPSGVWAVAAVLEGGQAWGWDSPPSIGGFTVGAACTDGFVAVGRRTAGPVRPLWVLSRRLLLTTTLVPLGVGAGCHLWGSGQRHRGFLRHLPSNPAVIMAPARGVFLSAPACGVLGLCAAAAMPRLPPPASRFPLPASNDVGKRRGKSHHYCTSVGENPTTTAPALGGLEGARGPGCWWR